MTRMGCVEQKDGRKWIGTIHPAFIMRMPDWKDAALDHLRKAARIAGVAIPLPVVNLHPTDQEVLSLVDHIMLVSREFSDDVETHQQPDVEEDDYVGSDYKVDMLGIGGRPYEALVLDTDQIHLTAPIFRDSGIWRYEHNGPYDEYHIAKFLQDRQAKKFDTMLATHYLRSFAPKKLKPFVVSQYTLLPYYGRDLEKVSRRLYNGMDIIATFLAAKEQRRQLKEWKLEELFFEFGMPLLPILEDIRVQGCNVDLKKALLFQKITQNKIDKANLLIAKICGPFFNPRSDAPNGQVAALLYDTYKLPEQHKLNTKRVMTRTVDFEARKRLRWWIAESEERMEKFKAAFHLLQLLDFLSGEEKKLEYLGRISGDGRIHPYYKAHGERPFRLSSTPNVQNFPVYDISAWGGARRDDNATVSAPVDIGDKDEETRSGGLGSLRSIVIPDHPEDVILTIDYSMLQLAIYAAITDAKWLKGVYERGEYVYGVVYEDLYKEPFFEPGKPKTKQYKLKGIPEQRIRRAKAVPLGFTKGRSIDAVAKEYGWTTAEATTVQRWWFSKVPEFLKLVNDAKYALAQHTHIRHAFGQIMHYPSKKLTEALDSYGQTNEAFVMIGSLIAIDKELKRRQYKNTRIILTVHDSLSLNVPENHCEEVYEEVVRPVLKKPIAQLGNFEFNHSAEVSKMWDWETKSFLEWKEQYAKDQTSLCFDRP